MRRAVYTEDHEAFREMIRDFVTKEVVPVFPEWEKPATPPASSTTGSASWASSASRCPRSTAARAWSRASSTSR